MENLGDFNLWLKENIHSKGDLYDPEELIKKATGTNLDSPPFLQYLNEKYGELLRILSWSRCWLLA